MLKICGAAMIVICGAMLAHSLNKNAHSVLIEAEGFIDLVRYLRSEIDCFSLPIPAALARCPHTILKKCGVGSYGDARNVRELLESSSVDGRVKEIMWGFASDIGRGYKHEQLALCDRTITLLESYRDILSDQLPAKRKVNGTLCLCFSLAIVILLI